MSEAQAYEESVLAPYAMLSCRSRGRDHAEEEHPLRTAFQRDRDRIIHTTAFRRLEYKTQVFVNHEGDYFRTRLTHTMETAQIARTIARTLRLNEDLAEAVALAHDLGHTPFGHAGERTLDSLMAGQGGFEHNSQSLRIVEVLEHRYPQFVGLNLTWEVREGIVKHSPPYDKPLAQRFARGEAPCLEAQIVDYADAIAYNSHDLDDGLKSGLLTLDQLVEVEIWRQIRAELAQAGADVPPRILRYQSVRSLINLMVTDLIMTTRERLQGRRISCIGDIRRVAEPLAGFSAVLDRKHEELKSFLKENLYRHFRVVRMTVKACRVMRELFEAYMHEPRQLPPHIQARCRGGAESLGRVIADYIAGMTDRFLFEEHRKLFDPLERV
jgi:dGTPase